MLAGGGVDNEGATLTFPTNLTPGTYYIGVLADYNAQIVEASETNNASNVVAVILGNSSANTLIGTSAADTIFGLGGDDTLDGGAGADTMIGGSGDDFIGEGIDTVIGGAGNDVFFGGQGSALNINLATSSIETVWGSFVGDVMNGSTATANLTMVGQGLTGGANADTMTGGSGNDFIYYPRRRCDQRWGRQRLGGGDAVGLGRDFEHDDDGVRERLGLDFRRHHHGGRLGDDGGDRRRHRQRHPDGWQCRRLPLRLCRQRHARLAAPATTT